MERIKGKIKAIIFDMDGTIIDTEHLWQKVNEAMFLKRGIVLDQEELNHLFSKFSGAGLENTISAIKKELNINEPTEDLIQEAKDLAKKIFENGIQFIEGFVEFHEKLRQHSIPSSIATNCDKETLESLKLKIGFHKFFGNHIYSIDHIGGIAKPNPAIFLHAAKKLNVEPHECIVFEDSVPGFHAAEAAGMKCIAIKNLLNKDFLHKVYEAIDSYHEAEEALSKILEKETPTDKPSMHEQQNESTSN